MTLPRSGAFQAAAGDLRKGVKVPIFQSSRVCCGRDVHVNDKGYAQIAERLEDVLLPLLLRL